MAIEKAKRHKSPGTDQMIKPGGITIHSEIHKLIISVWDKVELPEEWEESISVPIYKKGNKAVCSNYRRKFLLSTAYKILSSIPL